MQSASTLHRKAKPAISRRAGPVSALLSALLPALLLIGCGSAPLTKSGGDSPAKPHPAQTTPGKQSNLPNLPPANSGRGGYYQDDGPGDSPPPGLMEVPDAEPKLEPLARTGNKPYVVFGKTYTPLTDERPFVQRGIGTWYGRKFHGQRTSSGELYDMYKMTAAHPLLPIPSYARVTNIANGRQVIVRVNDRGPFHSSRVIDLSYTAALKLGLLNKGSHQVEVERLLPDEIARINARREQPGGNNSDLSARSTALALRARDAKAIREMDQALRSEKILPAPANDGVQLAQDDLRLQILRMEQQISSRDTPRTALSNLPATEVADSTPGNPAASNNFYLQLGAFSQADNAEAERQKLAATNLPGLDVVQSGNVYRIYSGPFASRAQAQQAALLAQHSRALVVQR